MNSTAKLYPQHQTGFTLTELVIVLVILGILSVVGIGLFASSDSYSSLLARDQFIASALLAQKRALANTDSPVTLNLTQDAAQWQFRVAQGSVEYEQRSADRKGTGLSIDGAAAGATQTFTFNRLGHTGANVELSFSGNSTHRACLASTGFAYAGGCQP